MLCVTNTHVYQEKKHLVLPSVNTQPSRSPAAPVDEGRGKNPIAHLLARAAKALNPLEAENKLAALPALAWPC